MPITTISPDPYENVVKMKPEPKRLVVEALRSGRFKQGQGYLAQALEDGVHHCCLGVMCEVAIEHGVEVDRVRRRGSRAITYGGNSILPPDGVLEWLFGTANTPLRVPVATDNDDPDTAEEIVEMVEFVVLNDDRDWSFEQIAQIIEDTL